MSHKVQEWFDTLEGLKRALTFFGIVFGWTIPNAILVGIAGDTSKPIDTTQPINQILLVICAVQIGIAALFVIDRIIYMEKNK